MSLRFAIFGAGFWSRFQLAAWRELPGVACVAVCDLDRSKAEALARAFGVPAVYDDPAALVAAERLDFVDIIASAESHRPLVELAAAHGLPAICQKPLAPTLADAEAMVAACRAAGTQLFAHENWRWQRPIRQLKALLDSEQIGRPFRARIEYISGFPVFANQPFLAELEQFILADMGSHILDVARFLFGEPERLYCSTRRAHADVRGEDVATVVLETATTTVICALAYAENALEREAFPQTQVFVEGEQGSLELAPGYWLRLTTAAGTHAHRWPPHSYAWADPTYSLVHASIVDCNANLLAAVRGEAAAETTGEDNLRTVRLISAAYESAAAGRVVELPR
jgi:predicted dehydrogenase